MKRLIPLLFVAAIALAAGCKPGFTPISQLLNDPGQYDHKTVRVAGKVTHAIGVLGYGGYQIDDGSGQMTIVTKSSGAPREGAEVGVEGEFRSGFTLGTESVAVIIESKRLNAK
jgi:hypothetical protein